MDIVDAIGKQNMKREIAFLRDKLKSQNEEIESLQEQLNHYAGTIQDMNKEIEDLRQMNDKCHELRLKFIDEQVKVIQEKDKEIESLREQVADGEEESEWLRKGQKAREVEIETLRQSIEAKDSLVFSLLKQRKDALLRGDKWKRRAYIMFEWRYEPDWEIMIMKENHPDAVNWFEEE